MLSMPAGRSDWCMSSLICTCFFAGDLTTRRYRPGISVLDNKIFVLGGEKYLDVHSSEIEFYNEETDTWTLHKSELPCSRSWLSCVVMRIRKGKNFCRKLLLLEKILRSFYGPSRHFYRSSCPSYHGFTVPSYT